MWCKFLKSFVINCYVLGFVFHFLWTSNLLSYTEYVLWIYISPQRVLDSHKTISVLHFQSYQLCLLLPEGVLVFSECLNFHFQQHS